MSDYPLFDCREALAEAKAEAAALREALEPFAALCEWLTNRYDGTSNDVPDDDILLVTDWEVPSEDRSEVSAGMIRAARTALAIDAGQWQG